MLDFLGPIFGIFAIILVVVVVQVAKFLGRARFRASRTQLVSLEDIPRHQQYLLGETYQQLAPLGFQPFAYGYPGDTIELGVEAAGGAVFYHPEHASYAVVSASGPEVTRSVVFFVTYTRNGGRVSTWPADQLSWLCLADDETYNAVNALSPQAIWAEHVALINQQIPLADRATGDAQWFCQREDEAAAKAVHDTREKGVLNNEGGLKFIPLIKVAVKAMRLENNYQSKTKDERKKLPPSRLDEESKAALMVDGYERNLTLNSSGESGNPWLKIALLVGSMVAFFVAFNQTMSWQSALVFLLVVGFHEAGHIVAMKLCGYRDLKVLFIPFIGAAAMGEGEEFVPPWKRLIVYFAGPLPGIAVGLALWVCTLYIGNSSPLLDEIIWIILFLNLFNLLPFLPLDGGHIVSLTLFSRFPILQTIMLGFSGLALGLGGLLIGSGVLAVIGLVMLIGIPAQYRRSDLLAKLRYTWPPTLERTNRRGMLHHLFRGINQSPFGKQRFPKIVAHAKQIYNDLAQPAASLPTVIASIFVYLSPLWMAMLLVVPIHFIGGHREKMAQAEARERGIPVEAAELSPRELPEAENAASLYLPLIEASGYDAEPSPTIELIQMSNEIIPYYSPIKIHLPRDFDEVFASKEVQDARQAIAEGLSRSSFDLPQEAPDEADEYTYRNYGAIARILQLEAAHLYANDQADAAYRKVIDILDVGLQLRSSTTPEAFFGSFEYADLASDLQTSLSLSGVDPSAALSRELQAAWSRFLQYDFANLDHLMDRRRLEYQSFYDYSDFEGDADLGIYSIFMWGSESHPLNRAFSLNRYDRAYQLELAAQYRGFQPNPGTPSAELEQSFINVSFFHERSMDFIGALQEIEYGIENDLVMAGLAQTALAIYAFEHSQGTYPDSLQALVPSYLAALPIDPHSGNPLEYQRIDDGFELYSVGEDMTLTEEEIADYEMWGLDPSDFDYDMSIFWQGRDAVVPEEDY